MPIQSECRYRANADTEQMPILKEPLGPGLRARPCESIGAAGARQARGSGLKGKGMRLRGQTGTRLRSRIIAAGMSAFAVFLAVELGAPRHAEAQAILYRWVDERGVVHFTDTPADDRWSIRAWIRNIEDEDNLTSGFMVSDLTRVFYLTEPRLFGVSLRYNFAAN